MHRRVSRRVHGDPQTREHPVDLLELRPRPNAGEDGVAVVFGVVGVVVAADARLVVAIPQVDFAGAARGRGWVGVFEGEGEHAEHGAAVGVILLGGQEGRC